MDSNLNILPLYLSDQLQLRKSKLRFIKCPTIQKKEDPLLTLLAKFKKKSYNTRKKKKLVTKNLKHQLLLKGGIPATPSGTATLLRLSPSYQFYPR
jgi:hypothetical protein